MIRSYITLYQDIDYSGNVQEVNSSVSMAKLNKLGGVGNDNLSSLKIGAGMQVTLYEHDGYKGTSRTYTNAYSTSLSRAC